MVRAMAKNFWNITLAAIFLSFSAFVSATVVGEQIFEIQKSNADDFKIGVFIEKPTSSCEGNYVVWVNFPKVYYSAKFFHAGLVMRDGKKLVLHAPLLIEEMENINGFAPFHGTSFCADSSSLSKLFINVTYATGNNFTHLFQISNLDDWL